MFRVPDARVPRCTERFYAGFRVPSVRSGGPPCWLEGLPAAPVRGPQWGRAPPASRSPAAARPCLCPRSRQLRCGHDPRQEQPHSPPDPVPTFLRGSGLPAQGFSLPEGPELWGRCGAAPQLGMEQGAGGCGVPPPTLSLVAEGASKFWGPSFSKGNAQSLWSQSLF